MSVRLVPRKSVVLHKVQVPRDFCRHFCHQVLVLVEFLVLHVSVVLMPLLKMLDVNLLVVEGLVVLENFRSMRGREVDWEKWSVGR